MTLGPADGALIEADLRPLVPTRVAKPDITMTFDLVVVRIPSLCYLTPVLMMFDDVLDHRKGSMEHQRRLLSPTQEPDS